jgi:biotin carboxylase
MGSTGEGAECEAGELTPAERNILLVCPTHRDYRELERVSPPGLKYLFHDFASNNLEDLVGTPAAHAGPPIDPLNEIEAILAKFADVPIAGVISSDDYPGSALAAAVAERLGLPGPSTAVSLICQHKYLSRVAQAKLVPNAVPPFALIDTAQYPRLPDELGLPCFVKPVKSYFSIGAETIASVGELADLLSRWAELDEFFTPLERMLEHYAGATIGTKRFLAEGLLKGQQVTVEGYVFGGKATIIGVVDSIMFPGTLAFSRFDYPSHLPEEVQARMSAIAKTLMEGLGFDNGMFNIEMMYDAESDLISIIEINPRMASQFADLYEKVDGTNSFTVLLDIALGHAPRFTPRQGSYAFAASCVLRSFKDHIVAGLPSEAQIERIAQTYPGLRVELHATVGRRLSAEFQDGKSYRYGIVNLGGRDLDDVLAKFALCREDLDIALVPVERARADPELAVQDVAPVL